VDRLTYVGHGTVLLRLGGVSVLTDPMLRNWLGPLRRYGAAPSPGLPGAADLILISHVHRDHLDVPSLRRIPPATPVLAPQGAGRWAAKAGGERITEVEVGETISLAGLEIKGVPAAHDGHRQGRRGPQAEALGYLIAAGGRTVYFAGDTDLFAGMSSLGPVDLALLPVWGWGTKVGEGHLDPERAARALELIRPRIAVPIHWGTFFPLGLRRLRPSFLTEPPAEFVRLAARMTPDVDVHVIAPGGEMEL
jgi:L-ascorbate metabolism protein UlaG (beta-lactamase superfamily)